MAGQDRRRGRVGAAVPAPGVQSRRGRSGRLPRQTDPELALRAPGAPLGAGRGHVVDLSATPFFLRGSGYAEGTLFPWTASDFSLLDAIESGIVKLPRVPVADNVPGAEMPQFRELWKHVGRQMPKKGRGRTAADPLRLPTKLVTALDALYGHYRRTFEQWRAAGAAFERTLASLPRG